MSDDARCLIDRLQSLGIKNPIILDIGANRGQFAKSVISLDPTCRIFAFEPGATARREFDASLLSNPAIELIPIGLSDVSGTSTLWYDEPGSELASLTRRNLDHRNVTFGQFEDIQLSTVDNWCKLRNLTPDAMKIDTEGHELRVLSGARQTLKHIKVLQFEFGGTSIDTRNFFKDYFEFFNEHGFVLYRKTPAGLLKAQNYDEGLERFTYSNWIAVRTEIPHCQSIP